MEGIRHLILERHMKDFPFSDNEGAAFRDRYYFLSGWLRDVLEDDSAAGFQKKDQRLPDVNTPIYNIGLDVRTINALIDAKCMTINDVLSICYSELIAIRNFGPKSWRYLIEALVDNGYITDPDGRVKHMVSNNLKKVKLRYFAIQKNNS